MYKRILLIPLALLALVACTPLAAAGAALDTIATTASAPAVQAVGATVVLDGSKALAVAHLTYESVGDAALAGRRSHLIGDAAWAQIKSYDNVVYGYLAKGDAAKSDAGKAAAAASALQALDALKSLVPASLFTK